VSNFWRHKKSGGLYTIIGEAIIESTMQRATIYKSLHDDKVWIEKGMAIAQIVFQRLDFPTDQPYEGKYQDQRRGPVGTIRDISDLSNAPGQGKVRGS